MNNELLRARLHAMRQHADAGRIENVSTIASRLADSARNALNDLPQRWDLSLHAADKYWGAAGLCDWAKGRKPRKWYEAAMLLRHALLIQAQPERGSSFMLALERHGRALVESERSGRGGRSNKRKAWADALAGLFFEAKYEVAWASIPEGGSEEIRIDANGEQFTVYRDGNRIVAVNDATGVSSSITRNTFERHYLSKAKTYSQ